MTTAPDLARRLAALPAAAPLTAALAGEPGVWIVGGAVRDLLLGGTPGDLDVVVEGDAAGVVRRIAAALGAGAEVQVHDRFGTATVRGGGHAYDVVRARAETYARPGALPDVRPGALEEDLARRDFTVNAIAVSLEGAVACVPSAFEDLDARVLRVLHERSFVDDPTRLLRLVRYATRLGFAVEPGTAALAAAAVRDGALETVSGARVGRELRLMLREPSAVEGLARVARWGADADWGGGALGAGEDGERGGDGAAAGEGGRAAIVAGLAVDHALDERACALLPVDGREDLLLLAGAALAVPSGALAGWLDRLGFSGRERDTVVVAAGGASAAAERLRAASRASEIAAALRGASPELAALAGAVGGPAAAAAAERWLSDLRHVRLAIDGDDLIAAGVPRGAAVGRGLAAALDAALDGTATDPESQLDVALTAAREG